MALERLNPSGLQKPPTYSHVVKAGNTIYIAGQTATDENGQIVGRGDFAAQADQVFQNIGKALRSVGADFRHLASVRTYVTDPRFREQLAPARTKYLSPDSLPASTLLVVAGLAQPDFLLEIDAVAVLD